jgi:RES domain-containing protein
MAPFRGIVYRALNVIWQLQPLSGEGAKVHGGRFNAMGTPCLYTSLTPATALLEATQETANLQPTTVVSYNAEFEAILDVSDIGKVQGAELDWTDFASPVWRLEMIERGTSASRRMAQRVITDGYSGMLVPSFAKGASPGDINLVLWRWGPTPPDKLALNDDENRLGAISPR